MKTSFALFVPVKEVAIVLEQDLQAICLIVPDRAEKGSAAVTVSSLEKIIVHAKLAKELRCLVVAIGYGLVERVAATLVFNTQVTSTLNIELSERDVAQHRSLQDVRLGVGLHLLACLGLRVDIVCLS